MQYAVIYYVKGVHTPFLFLSERYGILKLTVAEIIPDIAESYFGNASECLVSQKSLMRRNKHVRHHNQPGKHVILENTFGIILIKEFAFFLVDVKPRTADLTAFYPVNESLCINQRSPRSVEDIDLILHQLQGIIVDKMIG